MLETNSTSGTVGLHLKEVDGSVLASFNKSFVFEPASTIKALIHFHAMKQVEDESMIDGEKVTLDRQIEWFMDLVGSCPQLTGQAFDTLEVGLTAMMIPSDNRWTQAMRDFFGDTPIDDTRDDLDMDDSKIQAAHLIGCAGPAVANHNRLTLVDAGKLYEAVATTFFSQLSIKEKAYDIMVDESAGTSSLENFVRGLVDTMVNQEAQSLGLSSTTLDDFGDAVKFAAKAGGYSLSDGQYTSVAGWAQIPFLQSCLESPREYVFGAFIDAADSIAPSFSIWTAGMELLREQIRAALETQAACEADLEIVSMELVGAPLEIDVNTPVAITLRKVVRNNGPAAIIDAEVSKVATAPADCDVTPTSPTEPVLDLDEDQLRVVEEEFIIECSEPSFHTFKFDNEITPLDPNVFDPDLSNNTATIDLVVAVIAQADLAIVDWDFTALDDVALDDLLVSKPFFFPTTKVLHNFGDTVGGKYFTPVDANVWKTMVIPEGIEGSVHISADEAPATIIIDKPDQPLIVMANRPASTVVEVEGPATLSVHFMGMDLAVSVDRVIAEEFNIHCLEPSLHKIKFINEIMAKDQHIEDPSPGNNTMEVTREVECVTPVQINIRPGNTHNFVNPKGKGAIPVAILTTGAGEYALPIDFDATTIDPLSVRFGTKAALESGGGAGLHNKSHVKDSKELDDKTQDGDLDLVLFFKTPDTGIDKDTTEACAAGVYIGPDNNPHKFFGCDSVQTLP